MSKVYVPGKGNAGAKIAIVGEAPSYEEEKALEPFVGPSGRFLDSILGEVGINRGSCWITNTCKYVVPPNSKKGRKIDFWVRAASVGVKKDEEIEALRHELYQIKPNIILALGNTALNAVTGKSGIKMFRGSILPGMNGTKVIATYHPAHILHQDGEVKGYWNKAVMQLDLRRVALQSQFPELIVPHRSLNVCRSSAQFADFLERYSGWRQPAIDIEADTDGKCIPICVGISFTPQEGITIPLWNSNGVSDLPDSEIARLWEMLTDFLWEHEITGQNFGYDEDKLKRLGLACRVVTEDTMLKAFAVQPELPKNLAFNTSIYTEEPYYKDEGMYEGTTEDLLIGCARDACCTKEVSLAQDKDMDELGTRPYYENFLMKLRYVYARMEERGVSVDLAARRKLVAKYVQWNEEINYKLFKIAGHSVNVNSWQQVGKLLYEEWKIPERSGTSEEVLTSILNSNVVRNEAHREGISLILEGRRVRKTISTYLFAAADFDGRMRTTYFICLETGRSSTGQQEAPIRPTIVYRREGKKEKQARGMAFQTITKHGDIGQDIRSMLVPDEGYVFLQADSSQAEARVIFLLAEDYQALKDIDTHDYHALTASWFFGGTERDYSKKVLGYESPYRFSGKTLRHAGHLGQGKRGAAVAVNTDARKFKVKNPDGSVYKISEKKAEEALHIFHAKQPRIRQVFHAGIIACLERDRRLAAPVPVGISAKVGGIRTFFERWGDELNRQAFSYLPQRTVSENTKCAAIYIDSYSGHEIQLLMESHDSLLVQVKIEYAQEAASVMKYAFERPIDFSACSLKRGELVIPCEVEQGYNYQELSKFKWLIEEAV